MTQQEYIQQHIGQLVLQVAALQAELDKARAEIAKAKDASQAALATTTRA